MIKVDSVLMRDGFLYDLHLFQHAQSRLNTVAGFDFDVFFEAKRSFSNHVQNQLHLLGGMAGEW